MEQQAQFKARQFAIYSKKSAAQFKLATTKEGEILLLVDAANAFEGQEKKFNWDEKVTISLGEPDILYLLSGIRKDFDKTKNINFKGEAKEWEIFHDPGKGSATEGQKVKTLSIVRGTSHGYMLNLGQKMKQASGDPKITKVTVPLGEGQLIGLRIILEKSFLYISGFEDLN